MISVIIPTYNRANYIKRALESVINQTYKNVEVIVVDDNSSDNTEEIVKNYSNKHNFIKYIKHDKNKGGSAARNTGVENSSGDFIAFLDSDDEWVETKLEKCIKIFNSNQDVDLIYSDIYLVNELTNKEVIDKKELWDDYYFGLLQRNIIGGTSSIVIRRSVFEQVGGFKVGLPSCQDWDFYLEIAKEHKIYLINEPLTKYYIHPNSISGNIDRVIEGHLHILKKVNSIIYDENKYTDKKNIIISEQYFTIAYLYTNFKNFKKAKEYYFKALRENPKNKRALRNVVASICGEKLYYKMKDKVRKSNKIFHEI